MEPTLVINDMTEAADAPPRSNGELVFEAPWQGRVFGIAVALQERQAIGWNDFRDRLVQAITEGETGGEAYYESWLKALDSILVDSDHIDAAELEQRTHDYLNGERDEIF
ncbi:nitrile hydratase accessory protein [Nonomuraea cavernae]|uniref:nitrile hydratase accessory protein n=1 Tax=Nonomuraea cavernae TaxID=2045107 RepID=UPI0034037DDC